MPKIIMLDGSEKQVTYTKAVEIRAYLADDIPSHRVSDITDQDKRKTVEDFMNQVADVDFSDVPKQGGRPHKLNKPAIQKVLENPDLKGKARFDELLRVHRSGE